MYITTLFFIVLLINSTHGNLKIISSKSDNITFRFMEGIEGESELHECNDNEVCNAVHNRFWMPTLTERFCRCPNGKECPWQWSNETNASSAMILNNRSILQFCNSTEEMNVCKYRQIAATVHGRSNTNNSYIMPYNVTVNCICPSTHYWRLQKYTYEESEIDQAFICAKKRRCESLDFCGYIRSDLYSAYYRCTCPHKHLCIYNDGKTTENVQEFLYSGPAHKAYCYRFK